MLLTPEERVAAIKGRYADMRTNLRKIFAGSRIAEKLEAALAEQDRQEAIELASVPVRFTKVVPVAGLGVAIVDADDRWAA